MSPNSNELADALAWLKQQRGAMEALLRDLVETSSWTADKAGVDAAMKILANASSGRREIIASEKYGDHLAIHGGRSASDHGVVLIGHMDTVFPREKFAGYRSTGDEARGPGVLDMKGGLVIAAYGLKALEHVGALAQTAVSLVVVSDEEVGSPDSVSHLQRLATGARAALGFESGRPLDEIVTRRKGTGALNVMAFGRAAHAGNAHREGANAIWALSQFVDRAQKLTDYDRGMTVNVGKISGGIGKNTVPDWAEAQLDLRFVTSLDELKLRDAVRRAVDENAIVGTRLEIAWGSGRPPLERNPASEVLRDAYRLAQRESGLGDGEVPIQGGGSDAATTSAIGIPSIDGLGARGTGYHTLDERVDLRSLVPKAEALVRFLLRENE